MKQISLMFRNPNGANNTSISESIKWLPVASKPACYFSIDIDDFQMKEGYCYHRTEFWRNFRNDNTIEFEV